MILTLKESEKLNYIIHLLSRLDSRIAYVFYDEEIKYRNTEYENLLIGLTNCKKPTKHLTDYDVFADSEMTHYYKDNVLYYITVHRKSNNKLVILVYKTNNPKVNGLNFATKLDKLSCEV